jgi:hypothetical protein
MNFKKAIFGEEGHLRIYDTKQIFKIAIALESNTI